MDIKGNNKQQHYGPNLRPIVVPPARTAYPNPPSNSPIVPSSTIPAPEHTVDMPLPRDLATQRELFGFDDIPVGSLDDLEDDRSFRDILLAWSKQTYRQSISPKKRQRIHRFVQHKVTSGKDNLKWALKADLVEEPDTSSEPQTHRIVATPKQTVAPEPIRKTIDININLPSVPRLPAAKIKSKLSQLRRYHVSRRTSIIGSVLAALVILSFAAYHFFVQPRIATENTAAASGKAITLPSYSTVAPAGKTIANWTRVSPPDKNPVFAYGDTINGVSVSVSEQPLPKEFAQDTASKIETLATNYSATEKIKTGSMIAYLGASSQGPQSAIFTKNGLLILIKSTEKISNDKWAAYISSLQ